MALVNPPVPPNPSGVIPPAGDIGGTTGAPTVVATHLSSPLPIAQGGTASATAAAALTALGAAPATTPVTTQAGTSYTFVLADANSVVLTSNGSAVILTLPLNASVAYPVGTVLQVTQTGAGQVTIAAGGTTLNSPGGLTKTRVQYSTISALKVATDTWVLSGDLA